MPNITVTVLFHWTLLLNTQLTNLEKRRIICIFFFFGWFKEFVEAHLLCHTQVVILLLCLLFYWAQFVNHFVNIPFIVYQINTWNIGLLFPLFHGLSTFFYLE